MLPLVVSGPSGVGKSTLLRKLLLTHSACFTFSVSSTTRKPRPTETPGVDYHYLSTAEFQQEVRLQAFLETITLHGHHYGTHKSELLRAANLGKSLLLDIDVNGVKQLWEQRIQANYVFIEPESRQLLEERLRGRNTESEEKIQSRLAQADKEIAFMKENRSKFAGVVRYDYLEKSYPRLVGLLKRLYPLALN